MLVSIRCLDYAQAKVNLWEWKWWISCYAVMLIPPPTFSYYSIKTTMSSTMLGAHRSYLLHFLEAVPCKRGVTCTLSTMTVCQWWLFESEEGTCSKLVRPGGKDTHPLEWRATSHRQSLWQAGDAKSSICELLCFHSTFFSLPLLDWLRIMAKVCAGAIGIEYSIIPRYLT